MTFFSSLNDLKSLIDQSFRYKYLDKLACIDLILTNCPYYLPKSNVFETGLLDLHMMVITELTQTSH